MTEGIVIAMTGDMVNAISSSIAISSKDAQDNS